MFKKPLSYLLILLTLSSGFTKLYLYAGYQLNKKYIATTLCENKAKPELKCEGKCFLKKKITEAEKQEQKSEQTNSKSLFSDHFLLSQYRFKSFIRQLAVYKPIPSQSYYSPSGNAIFHPPQA